jgi:GAF domain-containing protein
MKKGFGSYESILGQLSIPDAQGTRDPVTLMSHASALLMDSLPDLCWAGFYRKKGSELYIGPYQGEMYSSRCPVGVGIAGRAAKEGKSVIEPDVHSVSDYVIESDDTQSAAAVPFVYGKGHLAVLYTESRTKGRFGEEDRRGLEEFVRILAGRIS